MLSVFPVNITPMVRCFMMRNRHTTLDVEQAQRLTLRDLTEMGAKTLYVSDKGLGADSSYEEFAKQIPTVKYDELRPYIERMMRGERDVLWPGLCHRYAQSSGTSEGKSKYIPITAYSLRHNHYAGAADCVAYYLNNYRDSRMFTGKGFILGGSYANELDLSQYQRKIKVGDLSATLIDAIPMGAGMFRVPQKKIALMEDWGEKLPALVRAAQRKDITNISGVPSWFLTLIRKIMEERGVRTILGVWPELEVFFHGGISFAPYREEYREITAGMVRFVENYNASEGYFACQDNPDDRSMKLLLNRGVFYEFIPLSGSGIFPAWEVKEGEVYELVITAGNGLWRYRIGDTVRIESLNPLKISIAGRTKSFINAFGEEVMEHNAEDAIARACRIHQCRVANYTVAPVYSAGGKRGRHQWLIEWITPPDSVDEFAESLDKSLQEVNSDYQAKRSHSLFLDRAEVCSVPTGSFDRWLQTTGSGKLGGQRKVPRLSNDRRIADSLLTLVENVDVTSGKR